MVFVIKPTETATFHCLSFYFANRTVLVELHEFYQKNAADMYPKFMSLMIGMLQSLSGMWQTVKHSFMTNMRLVEYEPRHNKTQWSNTAM